MKKPSENTFNGCLTVIIVGMVIFLFGLMWDLYTGSPSI